jgi:TonB family protein
VFTDCESRTVTPLRSSFRRHGAAGTSVAAHLLLLAVIAFHGPRIITLTPSSLAWGNGSKSYRITYLPPGNEDEREPDAKLTLPQRVRAVPPKQAQSRRSRNSKPATAQHPLESKAEEGTIDARAGSTLGRVVDGPIFGHEMHVAYPVVYPDPPVNRAELPTGLTGDVVIEVTIDAQGNVVETKIVQAIGHGIDEKIEATLRRWHYQPATLDGAPVASHHDVHFHFPS